MPSLTRLVQPKQFNFANIGYVQINGLAYPAAATMDVTAALTTAAATAGYDRSTATGTAVAVPHQAMSPTQMGWGVLPPNNRIEVYDDATGLKITSPANNEVFGRLTVAGAVYSLDLFQNIGGVETAFTPAAAVTIRAAFLYLFDAHVLPLNAFTILGSVNVAQDAATGQRFRQEVVAVTGLNTLAALTIAAVPGLFKLHVNGKTESAIGGATAPVAVAGTAITWAPLNGGYDLTTTDTCVAEYTY